MGTKKSQQEIKDQINGLETMKQSLPSKSFFGDDNHGKIDAQISILKGERKADYYYEDETAEEFEDGSNDIFFDAQRAEDWLKGDVEEDLFDND